MKFALKAICPFLLVASVLLVGTSAKADLIPNEVAIFGTYVFDENGSFAPPAANQSGTIYSIIAGVENAKTEYTDATVTLGNEDISALFSQHGGGTVGSGDGFGGNALVDATNTFAFRADTDLDDSNSLASPLNIVNNSALQRYRFEFSLTFDHQVDASGADAGLRSDIDLELAGNRIFNSELISDTVIGNIVNGAPASGFGGLLTASGTFQFSFELDPGEFTEIGFDYTMESAAYPFISSGQTVGSASYFLSIDNIVAVPEPSSLALVGVVVFGLVYRRRRR